MYIGYERAGVSEMSSTSGARRKWYLYHASNFIPDLDHRAIYSRAIDEIEQRQKLYVNCKLFAQGCVLILLVPGVVLYNAAGALESFKLRGVVQSISDLTTALVLSQDSLIGIDFPRRYPCSRSFRQINSHKYF